jgi:outer membrane lipoprotein-sorting protein
MNTFTLNFEKKRKVNNIEGEKHGKGQGLIRIILNSPNRAIIIFTKNAIYACNNFFFFDKSNQIFISGIYYQITDYPKSLSC